MRKYSNELILEMSRTNDRERGLVFNLFCATCVKETFVEGSIIYICTHGQHFGAARSLAAPTRENVL